MEIDILEDNIQKLDKQLLELLLIDRSTNRHIVWATNDYISYGKYYSPECEITADQIIGVYSSLIKPQVTKAKEEQHSRTRD